MNSTLLILESQLHHGAEARHQPSQGVPIGSPRYNYPDAYNTHGDERKTLQQWRTTLVASTFGPGMVEGPTPLRAAN